MRVMGIAEKKPAADTWAILRGVVEVGLEEYLRTRDWPTS